MAEEESELIARIEAVLPTARAAASRVGPMHANWDAISDYECIKTGKPTLLRGTKLDILRNIAEMLGA